MVTSPSTKVCARIGVSVADGLKLAYVAEGSAWAMATHLEGGGSPCARAGSGQDSKARDTAARRRSMAVSGKRGCLTIARDALVASRRGPLASVTFSRASDDVSGATGSDETGAPAGLFCGLGIRRAIPKKPAPGRRGLDGRPFTVQEYHAPQGSTGRHAVENVLQAGA